jgi:energy-coupling factor transport system ATP-binding protein
MLDPRGRRIVLETVQQLNEDYGLTVILITQSMDEAAVAERILALAGGRIVLDGAPRDVFTREHLLSEMGLGLPASIQITALLRKHGVTLDRTSLNVRELAAALRTAAAPP